MAYEVPTVDDFQEEFPDIVATEEAIQSALDAAQRSVDESWTEGDFSRAILYLAAHFLMSKVAADATGADDEISSLTIGPLSLTFKDRKSLSEFESTLYGQEFTRLLRLNAPRIAVI